MTMCVVGVQLSGDSVGKGREPMEKTARSFVSLFRAYAPFLERLNVLKQRNPISPQERCDHSRLDSGPRTSCSAFYSSNHRHGVSPSPSQAVNEKKPTCCTRKNFRDKNTRPSWETRPLALALEAQGTRNRFPTHPLLCSSPSLRKN